MLFNWISALIEDPAAPVILPDSVQKAHYAQAFEKLMNLDLQSLLDSIVRQIIWIGLKVFVALTIFFIGRWFIRRIVRLIDLAFEKKEVDVSLRSFARNTIRTILILVLLMILVQTLGVNVTSLIAIFSAATLAIGMALSGTAQNFAGGVMILVMKPYRVGDFIAAQGQSGFVREIKLFSTVITTTDNQTIYIPNNAIATAIIDNYSAAELRRVDWAISISYGDDFDAVRAAILEQLAADPRILKDPEAVVWIHDLGESSVNLTVRAWVKNADYWDVYFQHNEKFYKELPEKGGHFPFPQMDVHLKHE